MNNFQVFDVSSGPGRELQEIKSLLNSFKQTSNWEHARVQLTQTLERMLSFLEKTWHETERPMKSVAEIERRIDDLAKLTGGR